MKALFGHKNEDGKPADRNDLFIYLAVAAAALIAFIYLRFIGNNPDIGVANQTILTVSTLFLLFKGAAKCFVRYENARADPPEGGGRVSRDKPKIAALYVVYAGILLGLYMMGVLDMYMSLLLAFSLLVLDRVFVYGGCWLRIILMPGVKCCRACKIKDWDFFMITTPIYFNLTQAGLSPLNRILIIVLFAVSVWLVIKWEMLLRRRGGVPPFETRCGACDSGDSPACPRRQAKEYPAGPVIKQAITSPENSRNKERNGNNHGV